MRVFPHRYPKIGPLEFVELDEREILAILCYFAEKMEGINVIPLEKNNYISSPKV